MSHNRTIMVNKRHKNNRLSNLSLGRHPLQLGHILVYLLHVGAQRGEIGGVGIQGGSVHVGRVHVRVQRDAGVLGVNALHRV